MKRLEGKVVFITGGNSGIGKACAIEAAKEGAKVAVADLHRPRHEKTMREVSATGADAFFVPVDVTDTASVQSAVFATVEKFGRLDVALNNAGIGGTYTDIHDMEEEAWDRVIAVNLTGQFYCVKYELQQFLRQGGGVIVNMSSLAGLMAEQGLAAYTAAKHGLLGLTKNIAVQYADKNIRANAICPYYTDTPMLHGATPEMRNDWMNGTPAKRLGRPEEIAKAFIYFASDDSSYCNGTHLAVDGGAMA